MACQYPERRMRDDRDNRKLNSEASTPTRPRTVEMSFHDRLPEVETGKIRIDLRAHEREVGSGTSPESPVEGILGASAEGWLDEFSAWIGELNRKNACLEWWAYTSTAKNLLSSRLGMKVLEARAVVQLATRPDAGTLQVVGATYGQKKAILRLLSNASGTDIGFKERFRTWLSRLWVSFRLVAQSARVWSGFFRVNRPTPETSPDLCFVTYLDAPPSQGGDAYFGDVRERLKEIRPGITSVMVPYIYAPYRRRIRQLRLVSGEKPLSLFGFLRLSDHFWAIAISLRETFASGFDLTSNDPHGNALIPIAQEAMLDDLSTGGYLHNLLAYRAVRRMIRALGPQCIVYPYENKSLEKALILAVRAENEASGPGGAARLVGYQHTSVTPRHRTLLFEPGEAAITPLPDSIVTVGDVTRRWLELRGRYPEGMFRTGCALRQRWPAALRSRSGWREAPRILLALSSSRTELIRAVAFLSEVARYQSEIEIGVRPHPNFPISMLPDALQRWIVGHARDLSGTSLGENLEWCDVVAYVSSTVALEGLMAGRPLIKLAIDPLDPDPLLGDVRMRWTAARPDQVPGILEAIASLSERDAGMLRAEARDYLQTYFRPVTAEALELFAPLPNPRSPMPRADRTR